MEDIDGFRIFTFKKVDGKWKAELDGKTAFYLEQTFGLPKEIFAEEVNKMSKLVKFQRMFQDWVLFAEENNIDLDVIKQSNEDFGRENVNQLHATLIK